MIPRPFSPSFRPQLRVSEPSLGGREAEYVLDCLSSTWISSQGAYLDRFEQDFKAIAGASEAIALSNGTVALHCILEALGVGPGDEVLVPALTYVATANAVSYTGATPVLVDSEPGTYNIDPDAVAGALGAHTVGIIAVHLYGHPAEMDPIKKLASRNGLFVIEDAAEAHGATYRGQRVGSLATAAAFSFFGNKVITTGEGGMITTSDPELAAEIRLLKGQGVDPERRYWHVRRGFNYRMTNLAAAIGCAQLEHFAEEKRARAEVFRRYDEALCSGWPYFSTQEVRPHVEHAHWMYNVFLHDADGGERDRVMRELAAAGIETRPVFYPLHHLPIYSATATSAPIAERAAYSGISLPTHTSLCEADQAYVAEQLLSAVRREHKTSPRNRPARFAPKAPTHLDVAANL